VSRRIRSEGPTRRLGRNGCAQRSVELIGLVLYQLCTVNDITWLPTCLGIVYSRNVVHAPDDEVDAIRRPRKIVYFRARRPAHMLHAPCLLIFQRVVAERGLRVV
jgi:hypothetical protein